MWLSLAVVPVNAGQVSSQSLRWFDGERYHQVWLSADEAIEFVPQGDGRALAATLRGAGIRAEAKAQAPGARIWQLQRDYSVAERRQLNQAGVSSVFYHSPQGGGRMALTGELILKLKQAMPESELEAWLSSRQARYQRVLNAERHLHLIKVAPGLSALEWAAQYETDHAVDYISPSWWRERVRR